MPYFPCAGGYCWIWLLILPLLFLFFLFICGRMMRSGAGCGCLPWRDRRREEGPSGEPPLDVLKRRYAAGEISREQYEEMRTRIDT